LCASPSSARKHTSVLEETLQLIEELSPVVSELEEPLGQMRKELLTLKSCINNSYRDISVKWWLRVHEAPSSPKSAFDLLQSIKTSYQPHTNVTNYSSAIFAVTERISAEILAYSDSDLLPRHHHNNPTSNADKEDSFWNPPTTNEAVAAPATFVDLGDSNAETDINWISPAFYVSRKVTTLMRLPEVESWWGDNDCGGDVRPQLHIVT